MESSESKHTAADVEGLKESLHLAHKDSRLNRDFIEQEALLCGCFYCCKTMLPEQIVEYVDKSVRRGGDGIRAQTALCPNCGIDSILPWNDSRIYTLDPWFLELMAEYWFGEANSVSIKIGKSKKK